MDVFQIDTTLQLTGDFVRSLDGALEDPTDVIVFIAAPGGPFNTFTFSGNQVTKLAVGQYSYVFTPSISGTWTYKWQGVGTVTATSPDKTFLVQPSAAIPG